MKGCGLRHLQGSKASRLIRSVLNEIDLQHVRDTNPCQPCGSREEMYGYVDESSIKQEAIDYLEFGVFQGESIRYWASLNKNKDSRFLGFDSFEGLPEDWRREKPQGHFDVGGAMPRIDDGRVKFIKGWFEDTIPLFAREFSVKNRLLLHVDADLYGSAMLALVHLGPFMSKGTLIVFDEFYDRDHEFKALMDWQRIYRKNFRIIAEVGNYAQICAELM
jgi:O-methyltransferase